MRTDAPGLTRRSLVRAAAVTAGALGVSGLALAPGGGTVDAAPVRASGVITLTYLPWWVYWDATGKALLAQASSEFNATHKGLRAVAAPGPQGGGATTSGVISSILAGVGPDVVADCCSSYVSYLQVGAFANLTPYLQRDNIPLSTWSQGHLQALATTEGQMALPVYDGPMVFVFRQDIFDQLGLAYPDPDWTYKDAAKLWEQLSGTVQIGGKRTRRYGAAIANWFPYLLYGFGGAEMDNTHTKSLLGDPASIQGGEWVQTLINDNVVTTSADFGYSDTDWFVTGQSPMMLRGGWNVHADATNFGTKFEWDYRPQPYYPKGRATFANNDFWGLNAQGKNKEAAWELLKWLTAEDWWQEFTMKATLLEPCKLSLWDKWEYYWQQAAPVFRNKQIKWYKDAALGGYGYAEQFFKYQPSQAINIENQVMTDIASHKTDVAAGYTQMAKRINALEVAGPALAAAQQKGLGAAESQIAKAKASAAAITYPAPSMTGINAGVAPTVTKLIKVGAAGVVTISADGGAMQGSSDNCLFAGSAFRSSKGSVSCRLVSIALPKGGALKNFPSPKVGLLAAGDLAQQGAAVAVFFSGNRGVHGFGRPLDGFGLGDERPTSATVTTGLMGQNAVQVASTPAAGGNWLLKPLWLKLVLDVNTWQAYTSLDGKSWTVAGTPQLVEFAGAWVGVFATSNAQPLVATFDNLTGFQPTTLVQIGQV